MTTDEDDDYYDTDDGGYCCDCGGDGWIVTCIDDICHGLGYCIHGDGMEMCSCNTSCDPPSNAPADWRWTPDGDPRDCASPSHPGCHKCEVKAVTTDEIRRALAIWERWVASQQLSMLDLEDAIADERTGWAATLRALLEARELLHGRPMRHRLRAMIDREWDSKVRAFLAEGESK